MTADLVSALQLARQAETPLTGEKFQGQSARGTWIFPSWNCARQNFAPAGLRTAISAALPFMTAGHGLPF